METRQLEKEVFIVILASLILALTVSLRTSTLLFYSLISFLIIIGLSYAVKKGVGYYFETNVNQKFWSLYQWGFRSDSHFKKPIPMAWLPLILSILTQGIVWWFAILVFDVSPRTERIARKHGLYRFTQVTEWHMAWIASWGIISNILLAIIGYLLGFEFFAKLSVYYAIWSIIPIANSDGSKILFSSRALWATLFTILLIFFGWSIIVL